MCRERDYVVTLSLIAVLDRTDKSLTQSTPSVAFIDDQISDVDFVIIRPSCDGSNDSPNLVGRFIKGGRSNRPINNVVLKDLGSEIYELVFIMRYK